MNENPYLSNLEFQALCFAAVYVNRKSSNALEKFLSSKNLIERVVDSNLINEIRNFAVENYKIQEFEIEFVEKSFENALDSRNVKSLGATYTPGYIVENILTEVLDNHEIVSKEHKLLDPACGSGAFLFRAIVHLAKVKKISYVQASEMVAGFDIDPIAVSNSRILLDTLCLTENGEYSKARVVELDSLLVGIDSQKELINSNGGVGAIVGNPPYVKLQNLDLEYRRALEQNYGQISSGAYSLASLFLHNAPDYLTMQGKAGFITLNNIFTSMSAVNLRQEWCRKRNIYKILDFRYFAVFSASAYTCLIFMQNNASEAIDFYAMSQTPIELDLKSLEFSKVQYATLNPKKWRLGSVNALRFVSAIEEKGSPLGEVAEIRVGFATLLDKAFCGIYEFGKAKFIGRDGIERFPEPGALRSFYKVSEFKDVEIAVSNSRPIIFPYENSINHEPINLKKFKDIYPIAFEHLSTWKPELSNRDLSKIGEWHLWGRRQSITAPGPKLLTKTFDLKPTFRLDKTDSLFANGYSVKPREIIEPYDIHLLKRFLESRIVHLYALITSFEIAGGYQCYQKNFIEKICLPSKLELERFGIENDPGSFERLLLEYYGFNLQDFEDIWQHYSASSCAR